jgi:hypothetical protein
MLGRKLFLILMFVAVCGLATAYASDAAGNADTEKGRMLTKAQSEGLEEIFSCPNHPVTKLSARSIYLEEDFQGATFPPVGWDTTNYNPGFGWFLGTAALGGTQCALVTWDDVAPATLQDEWLFTPEMDVSGATSLLRLEFWFFKDNFQWEHEFKIYVSTVGGTNHADYTEIWDSYDIEHPNMNWYATSVDLGDYAGGPDIYLAFQYLGTDANLFGIDDIVVTDDSPPIGRCCYGDLFDPTCEDSITADSCDCLGGHWTEGLNCTEDPCPPFSRHIEPSDDMYSDPDDGAGHIHPQPVSELWTADHSACQNHHERIMMRFDLDDYMGMEIDSAFLNIYRWFRCPNDYFTACDFYYINQDWSEDAWNEYSHIGYEASSFFSYEFGPENDWYRIDIQTGVIEDWLDGTVTNYGLVIQAKYNEKFSKFYSKEGPAGFRPYLEMYVFSEPTCIPGDADGSAAVDIDDVVYLIQYIFAGGPAPIPEICCGDANGNGITGCGIDIDDVVYLIEYIFAGGPPPEDACTLCP